MAYFERLGPLAFRATPHVSGAWTEGEQHIAPSIGLLTHCVELDRNARRGADLAVARISVDILGTMPVGEVDVAVTVVRPGRTIELVEATLSHEGRDAARARLWLLQTPPTDVALGAPFPPMPPVDDLPPWDPTTVWPGGFIASAEVRRGDAEPGRAMYWVRPRVPLLDGEGISPTARMAGVLDISNGMCVRADPRTVAYPNVDLTAHFIRPPRGEWIGFDTTVSFGPVGIGLTHTVLHDVDGPLGAHSQILTIRPL